jgi:hypothetical protein
LSTKFGVRTTHEGFGTTMRWLLEPFRRESPEAATLTVNLYTEESDLDESPTPYSVFLDQFFLNKAYDESLGDVVTSVTWQLWRVFSSLTRDFLLLHAGVVVDPRGRAIAMPAVQESGKSSTTLALLLRGYGYLSDEFAAFDPVTTRLHPVGRPLSLASTTIETFFPEVEERLRDRAEMPITIGQRFVRPRDVGAAPAKASPLGAVVFPTSDFEGRVRIEEVTRADAVSRCVGLAFNNTHYAERGPILLSRALQDVPILEIRGGTPPERADAIAGWMSD